MTDYELCLALLKCDTEDGVVALLSEAGYWTDKDAWRYFGDLENNWSTIGNQQSSPHAALVEKLVNAVDATLMGCCYDVGIEPTAVEAPRTMRAAVAQFFENTTIEQNPHAGLIRNWPANKRTQVAQSITLVATGPKNKPCFTIADAGEGQTPDEMPNTLLSLAKSNKLRIPFVQGKFNMGGTGAFKFCGRHNLQLVISRRHPKALKGYSRDSQLWGFTVIRREAPERDRRSSVFTYLAPLGKDVHPGKGGVPRFTADEFPFFPLFGREDGRNPYGRNAKWGTAIKLYEYSLPAGGRSNILMADGLMRRTDLLLPDTALPIRFCEAREFKGHAGSFENTLTGLSVRLDDDKTDNLEEGFPTSCPLAACGESMKATIYAFKKGKAKTYRNDEGIVFTQNGQTHGHLTPDFFRRKNVGLSYLSDSLLVVVDCSMFSVRAREDVFMNSRDRLSRDDLRSSIESELEDMLKNHQGLRDLKERRRREETQARLADSKPLEDVLETILKHSPSLANLFLLGKRAANPFKTREVQENEQPYHGNRFPTYFKFKGKDYGFVLERETHRNMRCRISFETDADNDYFSRTLETGEFSLTSITNGTALPVSNFAGPNLNNGVATLSVRLPEESAVGSRLEFLATVTDPYRAQPFENRFLVLVKPDAILGGGGGGTRRNPPSKDEGKDREQTAGITLPNIIEVTEEHWPTHEFDRLTALKIKDAGDGDQDGGDEQNVTRYDFFINVDNLYLKAEMKSTKADVPLLKARFMYGMVLVGLGMLQQDIADQSGKNDESDENNGCGNIEERVERVTKALAPIMLPMIDSLGALDVAEVESSSSSGEAT
jgi:hypothetical protein